VLLTYIPDDGEKREFSFRPRKLVSAEAEAIEDATGWTFDEFGQKFLAGSMKAKRAALWVLLKREHPTLKFRDLSITPDEVALDFEPDEAAALREQLAADDTIDPEQRENILAILDEQIAQAPKDETPSPTDSGD